MATLRMEWTPSAKSQFTELRQRAIDAGVFEQFKLAHNEIAIALGDLTQVSEKGEPLYRTRKPGGEVRHWVNRFISVCYVVFQAEQAGWILSYQSVPASWPR